jgi:hypothetical protein
LRFRWTSEGGSLAIVNAESRDSRIAEALTHVRNGNFRDTALRAVGIFDTKTLTAEERDQFDEAEQEAIDGMIDVIRKAAKSDPTAARWLRERGIPLDT